MPVEEKVELAVKIHIDAIGNHPKAFFLSLNLFSPDGLSVFEDGRKSSSVLPKYVAVGSDTKSQGYAKNALQEIAIAARYEYRLKSGHIVVLLFPVIIGADRAVLPSMTGAVVATMQGAAIFDVTFCVLHFLSF